MCVCVCVCVYRQLNVYRIRLHKNMFISILINCVLVIIMKVVIILPQLTSSKVEESYIKQVSKQLTGKRPD